MIVFNKRPGMPRSRPVTRLLVILLAMTPALASCMHQPALADDISAASEPDSTTPMLLAMSKIDNSPDSDSIADAEDMHHDEFAIGPLEDQTLWGHIRDRFVIESGLEHERTRTELEWYRSNKQYLDRVMTRAEPFLHYILTEAEKRNLPTELVLLPIVESAFQPFAYSHGRAAGLWQFIPSTGRMYGLKQNWWYDGRRDIHASTQAALNYLEALGKEFHGDWLHALAAYNAGSGNVRRAIRKNKKHNKPTDYWNLSLPRETQQYVPKLLALKEIVTNPREHEVTLHCIPYAPGFIEVDTGSQIDLALAAELADIDIETLYMYNPAFNRWATPPDGPHRLILPAEAASLFEENLETLPEEKRLTWKRHEIGNGETLSEIAVKYNTTVDHLRKVNKIHGNNIRAGKHLLIPVASRERDVYSLTAGQRKQATQNTSRGETKLTHIVKSGESFWEISREYGVNMHKLAKWNAMAIRDPLREGQKLVIWTSDDAGQRRATPAKGTTMRTISYTVRNGDSLARIADRYRVSIADLQRWNTIKGKYLQPGQKLKLHIDVRNQS